MDGLNQKYKNFLKLCLDIDDKNEWCTWIQNIDVSSFVLTIREKNNLSIDEIYEQLITTTKLEHEKVKPFTDKIKRYIEYFKHISNVI